MITVLCALYIFLSVKPPTILCGTHYHSHFTGEKSDPENTLWEFAWVGNNKVGVSIQAGLSFAPFKDF